MVFDTTALAEQARIQDHWSVDEGRYLTDYLDEQKFAELIVAECISQAVKEEERYDSMGGRDCEYCSMAMANFQGVLAEHFGVDK